MEDILINQATTKKSHKPTWVFEFNEEGRPVPVLVDEPEEEEQEQEQEIVIEEVEVLTSISILDHPYLTVIWKGFFYIFLPFFVGYLFIEAIPTIKAGFQSTSYGIGKAFAIILAIAAGTFMVKEYFLPYLHSTSPRQKPKYTKQNSKQHTSRQSFNIHVDIDINN